MPCPVRTGTPRLYLIARRMKRCYHLVSRLAHRAFFLDDEEKDRAVALMRRVEEFSGVVVLAYAFMSNHFHIFIYVPSAEQIGEEVYQ